MEEATKLIPLDENILIKQIMEKEFVEELVHPNQVGLFDKQHDLKVTLEPLKCNSNFKTSEEKNNTLFSHGDCVKEENNKVNEFALVKKDEIKMKPNLSFRVNLFFSIWGD